MSSSAAIGYDHGYDAEVFYLGLALDERYVEGFVGRIGEDDAEEELLSKPLGGRYLLAGCADRTP